MPELPEVETIRRQIEPEIVGRTIVGARVLDERWTRPEPPGPIARRWSAVRSAAGRRGKYLLLGLDDGSTLLMHLRMTGNLLLRPTGRAAASAWSGSIPRRPSPPTCGPSSARRRPELQFTDPRRFGHASLLGAGELDPYLDSRIGVEPLPSELTVELIGRVAEGRKVPLKSFLLDQRGIAGIGNIYADEALHRAELHPLSPAGSMRARALEALRDGIVAALEEGLRTAAPRSTTIATAAASGARCRTSSWSTRAPGRSVCAAAGAIERIVVGGRSTYFCPDCQVRLRRRRRPKRRAQR